MPGTQPFTVGKPLPTRLRVSTSQSTTVAADTASSRPSGENASCWTSDGATLVGVRSERPVRVHHSTRPSSVPTATVPCLGEIAKAG